MKRHFEDVQLGSIELFCLAAEASSFTAAAQVAGVTPAAVSRSISRFEERLGSRLFVRPSRPFTLLYPHGRYVPHRVRAFVDFLMQCRDEWAVR